ncbi:hypothetical protein R83H12_00798 [Fibrobacteria bacterium R8-3-H12]
MCGESEYTPETQGCCNDSVYDLTRDGKAQFCDERDGKKYVYVSIGTQTWMAENLNYSSASSYNWATAMGLSSSCNTTACSIENHRGICPTGWHIPSDTEWTDLITLVGSTPGTKLKAKSGWGTYSVPDPDDDGYIHFSGNGSDANGFTALPSTTNGTSGYWWSSTEFNASTAYCRGMSSNSTGVSRGNNTKSFSYSVRCVQD